MIEHIAIPQNAWKRRAGWLMLVLDTGGEVQARLSSNLLHDSFEGGDAGLFRHFSP